MNSLSHWLSLSLSLNNSSLPLVFVTPATLSLSLSIFSLTHSRLQVTWLVDFFAHHWKRTSCQNFSP